MKDILNHSGEIITIEPQLSNTIPFRTEIKDFPNYTFYPHEGKIYSHNQERFIGYYDKARIEKCNRTKSYTQVAIYNNRRRLFGTVGTLIWLSVFGSVPDDYEIHHIDGDAKNNKISNLMLVTREQHHKIHRRDYAELYGYLIYTDNEGNEKIFQTIGEMTEATGYKRNQIGHGLNNKGILKGRIRRTAGKLKRRRDEAKLERN